MLHRNSDFLHFWVPFRDFTKLLKIIKIYKVGCDSRSGNRTKLIWMRKPDFTKEEWSPNQRFLNKNITLSLFANQNRRSKQSSESFIRFCEGRVPLKLVKLWIKFYHGVLVCRKWFSRRRSPQENVSKLHKNVWEWMENTNSIHGVLVHITSLGIPVSTLFPIPFF